MTTKRFSGDKFSRLMKKAGVVSTEVLAGRISAELHDRSITGRTLRNWRVGVGLPDSDCLEALAVLLGCEKGDFYESR